MSGDHPDWHDTDPGWRERERGFALARDLAESLRTGREYLRTWLEVETTGGADTASGRMDVFAMRPRWGGLHDTRAYEVKVNRRDFVGDVRAMKFTKSFAYCRRFYYAVPSGLVTKTEVPPGCGLIVKTERGGWRVMVQPAMRDVQPTAEFLISLLNHQDVQTREQRRLRDRVVATENQVLGPQTRRMGREIAQMVNARRRGEMIEESLSREEMMRRGEADRLLEAMRALWKASGHEDDLLTSHMSPTQLVEWAAGMMRDAQGIRRVGQYLTRLPYGQEGDGAAVLDKLKGSDEDVSAF